MRKNIKTICAFGSFDILHPGHIAYVKQAAALASRVVAVVTPDDAFLKYKGKKPLFDQSERLQIVAELRTVDDAVLGDADGSWNIIRQLAPALILLGYDQANAKKSLLASQAYRDCGSPKILVARAFRKKKYQSSVLKSNIIHMKS